MATTTTAPPSAPYPMSLSIDYPDRNLNRLTTAFRILTIIPIGIVVWALTSGIGWQEGDHWRYTLPASSLVVAPTLLMILFRQKYPRWWFDWNLALARFITRFDAYISLLRDEYPSTDEEQAVHLEIPYPDAKQGLNRWLPLVKWLLAIPHYIVLAFLGVGAFFVVIVAWFAILFTGRYPRDLFNYIVGVSRWALRVQVYASMLTTDRYPPFRLGE